MIDVGKNVHGRAGDLGEDGGGFLHTGSAGGAMETTGQPRDLSVYSALFLPGATHDSLLSASDDLRSTQVWTPEV